MFYIPLLFLLSASCSLLTPTTKTITTQEIPTNNFYNTKIFVGSVPLFVFIANTDVQRQKGLSGMQPLSDNEGMLFNFKNTTYTMPGFWMKDMLFDLDLIWISKNKIVGISKNVPRPKVCAVPPCELPLYYPPTNIDTVLEVKSGWSESHNIQTGMEIR